MNCNKWVSVRKFGCQPKVVAQFDDLEESFKYAQHKISDNSISDIVVFETEKDIVNNFKINGFQVELSDNKAFSFIKKVCEIL